MKYFSILDFLYGPLAFMIIVIMARVRKYGRIKEHPEYKYYTKGLYVKMLGGLALCFIYTIYYGGGDTLNYFTDSICMMRLLVNDPAGFYVIMRDGLSIDNYFYFTEDTGYPIYYRDLHTFFVVRISTLIVLLGAGSFIVSTLLFAYLSYGGMWRLYQLFIMEFPQLKKEMAIAVLFIPSVFFWGSGIMKDTITLSAIGYYSYSFYMVFIRKEKMMRNFFTLVIATYIIMSIKPYIVFALLPGSLIWYVKKQTGKINNTVIKFLGGPFILTLSLAGGYLLLLNMSGVLGAYSVDTVLEKAVLTNTDLKADYYAGNTFDIGEFDATVPSMLAKAPEAISAALFRPYLWESRNIVMLLSGLEGFLIMLFTIRVVLRLKVFGVFPMMVKNHLLTFSLIFSLFFAFSVGISTSNFGSMVRYRIPVLPFYVASLFIMNHYWKMRNKPIEIKPIELPQEKTVKVA
jgi:hypothetical protein